MLTMYKDGVEVTVDHDQVEIMKAAGYVHESDAEASKSALEEEKEKALEEARAAEKEALAKAEAAEREAKEAAEREAKEANKPAQKK